ncbi:MAG: M1 family metallopeptidase [Labilithrix sp.]|nr:M1 family metallopeptidase [Labilithrix sp.]MCW5816392.1 M1 family metallopeptidase [Labilithrix sp.]
MRLTIVAAALLVGLVACPGEPPPPPPLPPPPAVEPPTVLPPPLESGRLPALAIPRGYSLDLDVDPTKDRFSGVVRIEAELPEKTSFVVLHARGLHVRAARAVRGREAPVVATTSLRTAAGARVADELVLAFPRPLAPGWATLVLEYDAPFDDTLAGVYRVKEGERWYAFSQLEATAARRAFPCFDEPSFKVPFDVAIRVPPGMTAVSNTAETMREDAGGGKTRVRFARTQPLPTYLVALAVGDLAIEAAARGSRPPIRIVTTKAKANGPANKPALDAAGALVDALASWFGIPYPYDKLDLVAVPALAAGAMENPGLVTFREELLLVDPARASTESKRDQAEVIAHELAHQWFGNLVTAAWWNDLWLNEGMATWMQAKIVHALHPEWGVNVDAVVAMHEVMDTDGLAAARRVRQPVLSSADVEDAFDGITYQKGAAVLSTIERWIGEAAFQKAIKEYLGANAHQSVPTQKLFEALDRASGKDVTSLASGYLDQAGVPEVVAGVVCEQGSRWHVELGARSWRPLGATGANEDDNRTWNIPVCLRVDGAKKDECVDLVGGAPSLTAGRGACPAFVHPNTALSYYRWSLPEKQLVKLAESRASVDVPARVSVLSNTWSAVRSGDVDAKAVLKVLPAFDAETARQPVTEVVSILHRMSRAMIDEETRPAFRKFARARLEKRKKALGWTPAAKNAGDDALLRRTVLVAMADVVEDEATLKEAEELARKWLADPSSVDPDVATFAVSLGTRRAKDERIDALVKALKEAKNEEDHGVALAALGAFDDPAVLERALDRLLGDDVATNEIGTVLASASHRRASHATADRWVQKHWDELRKKLPGHLSHGLLRAPDGGCTTREADEDAVFYGPRAEQMEGGRRALEQSLESVAHCVALRRKGEATLHAALVGPPKKK